MLKIVKQKIYKVLSIGPSASFILSILALETCFMLTALFLENCDNVQRNFALCFNQNQCRLEANSSNVYKKITLEKNVNTNDLK